MFHWTQLYRKQWTKKRSVMDLGPKEAKQSLTFPLGLCKCQRGPHTGPNDVHIAPGWCCPSFSPPWMGSTNVSQLRGSHSTRVITKLPSWMKTIQKLEDNLTYSQLPVGSIVSQKWQPSFHCLLLWFPMSQSAIPSLAVTLVMAPSVSDLSLCPWNGLEHPLLVLWGPTCAAPTLPQPSHHTVLSEPMGWACSQGLHVPPSAQLQSFHMCLSLFCAALTEYLRLGGL